MVDIKPVDPSGQVVSKSRTTPFLAAMTMVPSYLWPVIASVQEKLREMDPRQIYHPPSYFHVTLKPLGWLGGRIGESQLPELLAATKRIASQSGPFTMSLEGIGVFPDVIHVKVSAGGDRYREIHVEYAKELGPLTTVGPFEGSNFTPHVTIATFISSDVEPLLKAVEELGESRVGRMEVRSIRLVRAYFHRIWGPESERAKGFEEIAAFDLTG